MAITYRIDRALGLVHTTATGTLTDEDLADHKRALLRDPDFKPGMKELSDVRAVEQLQVTVDGVRRLVALDKVQSADLVDYQLAIVVSADLVFGMARMYETLTEDSVQDVGVFRDMEEAKAWLGVAGGSAGAI